ncbi:MAG: hypothetical protein ABIH92_05260 [Nanoarchaeota archaeon]
MEKPLKVAAWSGIISLIVSLVSLPFLFLGGDGVLSTVAAIFVTLIGGVLGAFFLYGFVVLGKRFKNTLLVVMAWIGIVFAILSIFMGLIGNVVSLVQPVSAQDEISVDGLEDIDEAAVMMIMFFLIVWVLIAVVIGVYTILFGVAILRLKDKVCYSKPAGILNIVAGATYVIFVGFLVRLVAFIFEIMLMFNASEKFEK